MLITGKPEQEFKKEHLASLCISIHSICKTNDWALLVDGKSEVLERVLKINSWAVSREMCRQGHNLHFPQTLGISSG